MKFNKCKNVAQFALSEGSNTYKNIFYFDLKQLSQEQQLWQQQQRLCYDHGGSCEFAMQCDQDLSCQW
jgi:hypothetical protein